MKLFFVTVTVLLLAINPAAAAESKPDTRSFGGFWSQFKAALATGNKEAIAGMTKFPFVNGGGLLSKAEFVKQYDAIFSKNTRKCLEKAKPTKEQDRDSYSVFCGSSIFTFERTNGEYRFTDIGEND
jgi:hypothetical protein